MTKIVLVLGDQLSHSISSLARAEKSRDRVLMAEVMTEATYVKHHKKKIALIFSAMRHFAEELRGKGWQVDYVKLDDVENTGSLKGELQRCMKKHAAKNVLITEAAEYRLQSEFSTWSSDLSVPVEILDDDRFICKHTEFEDWAEGKKQLRMEFFYREMRRKTNLLMEGDKPTGYKWNFDSENRKPAKNDMFMPKPPKFEPSDITSEVLELVENKFPDHFGDLKPYWFAATAVQAEEALEYFLQNALPNFGDFQDAMLTGEPFLYHSVISGYINCGLLDPLHVCQRVEAEYRKGRVPLNAAEGYIRQIIGWREYMRGIYWLKMPDYLDVNFFEATRDLPEFYWTGKTDMSCLSSAIGQTKTEAYAHHIQRLMVTGNFALLSGIEPKQVHEWYLAVYTDAYEWVELPNTVGMALFADGGLLGSKPYAASGNYINKMSDYCKGCKYKVKDKSGPTACPFNYLYWDFMDRNKEKLKGNHRMGQVFNTLKKMNPAKLDQVKTDASKFLDNL